MKRLWTKFAEMFRKLNSPAKSISNEPFDESPRLAEVEVSTSGAAHKWATNAPDYWPDVIGEKQLNSMGFGDEVTADPFGKAAFAVMLLESFKASPNLSIENLDATEIDSRISLLINDSGKVVPAVIYPETTIREASHFVRMSAELLQRHDINLVYFAPSRLPDCDGATAAQLPDLNTNGLLPRIASHEFLLSTAIEYGLVSRPVGNTGLGEVVVVDSETQMAFVDSRLLRELNLTEEQAFDMARSNLRKKVGDEFVERLFADNLMPSFKTGDGFDAARILVVPQMLNEGQQLAALIPDRDTLVLLGITQEKDNPEFWESLSDFPASSDHLIHDRPLLVTCAGIELR